MGGRSDNIKQKEMQEYKGNRYDKGQDKTNQ